jgi:uncharacterized protein YukE
MSFINVDHSKLEKTAGVIDDYVKNHKDNMNSANNEITTLGKTWKGIDYNELKKRWDLAISKESTSQKMISSLENYSKFLRFASNEYKKTQKNAIKRANSI